MQNHWTAKWKWSRGQVPIRYQSTEFPNMSKEAMKLNFRDGYTMIGCCPTPKERLGPPKGLVPLMAVIQHKHKVHPVGDYNELY